MTATMDRQQAVFTIPAGLSFVDVLAAGLLERTGGDAMALAAHVVLLPTRRACRSLREAFLRRAGGRPMLLPRMMPLGDLDEDELSLVGPEPIDLPPALSGLKRQLLLTRLILAMGDARGGSAPTPDQAVRLAAELGRLIDAVHTERLGFARLETLVPDDLSRHWQITLQFLEIVTDQWPIMLAEQGCIDAADRRNRILGAQAALWRAAPPAFPVIAAGSTGSVPATADLLAVIAGLPSGQVILPGLDTAMDAQSWQALEAAHPQYGLKRLLDRLGVEPGAVAPWSAARPPLPERTRLVSEAMRPAATTDRWRSLSPLDGNALDGVTRLDCPGPREEAGVIALMLREAAEFDGRTAALVTPDRTLARRVAAEMARWGIGIDDSAGHSLDLTAPGAFLLLTARMAADDFAPHAILAALKHPLAAGGQDAAAFRAMVRRLEHGVLRGPRPDAGLAGLRKAAGRDKGLDGWLAGLEIMAAPFAALAARGAVPLPDLVRAHMEFAEALATDHRLPGPARLWKGEAGEAAAAFAAELADAAAVLPPLAGAAYPALLAALMAGRAVRPQWGGHPRLHIWGPLEARLQHADLVILGGLNEGTWPPEAEADPWMSRPMREDFGLPPPERRIGLSAHDFAQAFCAPRVVLTRAARVDGTPTVPSRWLLRLDTVLKATGLLEAEGRRHAWQATVPLDQHALLDRPDAIRPARPPAPRPPLMARPRTMSVTRVETWMRDPYAVYARSILGLEALKPIDADPGAADYGTLVHKALEVFLDRHRDRLPADAEGALLDIGREVFAAEMARPGVWAFWWPRFERIARWFVATERERRPGVAATLCEIKGTLEISAPGGPFTLTAKADRIDVLKDGGVALIDYKTGSIPSKKEVAAGFSPQLPLEAVIARHGGFPGVPPAEIAELAFWRLSGGEQAGEEKSAGDDPMTLADEALAGLVALIAAFDDPATPYEARPHPDRAPRYSDYLHLARVKEWASGGDEGEE